MTMIFLALMWMVDGFGVVTGVNISHVIDVLNELFYIFEEHPALNAVLFTGILLIISAVLFSRLEKEIKGGIK